MRLCFAPEYEAAIDSFFDHYYYHPSLYDSSKDLYLRATLYIIHQDERIDKIEKSNAALKMQNEELNRRIK